MMYGIDAKQLIKPIGVGCTVVLSIFIYKDFQKWRQVMIPGGLPDNIFGYFISQLCTWTLTRERRSLKSVDFSTIETLDLSSGFLKQDDIPDIKDLETPIVAKWLVPHRQIFPKKLPNSHELFQKMFDSILKDESLILSDQDNNNPQRLIISNSLIEPHIDGIFLNDCTKQQYEVCHYHPADGTLHVYLNPFDACIVLSKGWGELHPLRAKFQASKSESVLLFTLQDEGHLSIHKEIVIAAIKTNISRTNHNQSKKDA